MRWIALAVILGAGCAATAPCRICRQGAPGRTFINPRFCKDLPDGRFTCDHVIFDPRIVRAK
jgi:hypothetical protein